MLPLRPLRAALLAFIGALVLVEIGSGLVAGEAWRQQSRGALSPERRMDLHDMLGNLRGLEDLIVGGVLATTIVWALLALHNATFVAHGSRRTGAIAAVALFAGPVLFLVVRAAEPDRGTGRLVNIALQALALYVPFWGLGRAADGIGGTKLTFFRWYLALGASYVLHALFTAQLDVLDPKSTDEFGRTTMMFLINALVVAVMGVMAAEATRSMDRSTVERALQHQLLRNDASRSRGHADGGPLLPPPTPAGMPITAPPSAGAVAVLDAPAVAPAPTLAAAPTSVATLAPPTAAPVIAGPSAGAMPLPTLAAVQVPSVQPIEDVVEAVTPAVAIPVIRVETSVVEASDVEGSDVEPPDVEDAEVSPVDEAAAIAAEIAALLEELPAERPVVQPPMTVADVDPAVAAPAVALPPPVPAPLPPPPPGSRSSLPKLLTITEMRPIPVIEPEVEEVEPEAEVEVAPAPPEPVSGFSSMFQPLTPRQS